MSQGHRQPVEILSQNLKIKKGVWRHGTVVKHFLTKSQVGSRGHTSTDLNKHDSLEYLLTSAHWSLLIANRAQTYSYFCLLLLFSIKLYFVNSETKFYSHRNRANEMAQWIQDTWVWSLGPTRWKEKTLQSVVLKLLHMSRGMCTRAHTRTRTHTYTHRLNVILKNLNIF